MSYNIIDSVSIIERSGHSQIVGRCVKFQPTYKNNGGIPKPKRFPIDQMESIREQEAAIFQDLLHVLVGLEGFYIRYAETFNLDDPLQRLSGPDFLINKHLDPSLKDITKRINRLGKYYSSLEAFIELYDNLIYGQSIQALCFEIKEIMKYYESFLVQVEHEFNTNPNYSLILLEQDLNVNVSLEMTHIYEIVAKINKENELRMDSSNMDAMRFESMLKSLKDDYYTGTLDGVTSDSRTSRFVKGGMVLNIIQQAIDHYKGDVSANKFLSNLFNRVSLSYIEMLNIWLETGVVNDPYDEFLIDQNRSDELSIYSESYWAERFTIRNEGLLKQFSSRDIQKKIILTGKYLKVLRECGIDIEMLPITHNRIETLQDADLYIVINNAYMRANRNITGILSEGYHIKEFLKGLNKYFLLTNNHDFNDFMNMTAVDLRKPKNQTSLTSLIKQFEFSFANDARYQMSSSSQSRKLINSLITLSMSKETLINELQLILTAQTTDAEEVFSSTNIDSLKKILNSTLEANNNQMRTSVISNTKIDDYSIHCFTLDIEIPFPLNLIITRSQVFEYQLIARNMSYLKLVEKSLEQSWREISYQKFWTWRFKNERLRNWVKRSRIAHTKMRDFMRVYSFYINFDVIEKNWTQVENTIDSDSAQLEDLFGAIKSYLSTILAESLLTKLKLVQIINQLFVIILLFHNFLMSLRKSLILMDRDLFNEHQSKLSTTTQFDSEKNSSRMNKISEALKSYQDRFEMKFRDLMDALKYYGEIDSPSLLSLYDELSATFGITSS